MNINNNNVSFAGKKEIMYGLINASKFARDSEVNRLMSCGPHRLDKSADVKKNIAVMNAYIDMAVNDSEFKNVISTVKKDNDTKTIAANLKFLDSLRVFKQALSKQINKTFENKDAINLDKFWSALTKK